MAPVHDMLFQVGARRGCCCTCWQHRGRTASRILYCCVRHVASESKYKVLEAEPLTPSNPSCRFSLSSYPVPSPPYRSPLSPRSSGLRSTFRLSLGTFLALLVCSISHSLFPRLHDQRLTFAGRDLESHLTLSDLNIQNECTLTIGTCLACFKLFLVPGANSSQLPVYVAGWMLSFVISLQLIPKAIQSDPKSSIRKKPSICFIQAKSRSPSRPSATSQLLSSSVQMLKSRCSNIGSRSYSIFRLRTSGCCMGEHNSRMNVLLPIMSLRPTAQSFCVRLFCLLQFPYLTAMYVIITALRRSARATPKEVPQRASTEEVQIFVKNLNGKSMAIMVSPSDTVESLRNKVEAKTGIPPSEQRLLYGGKQLSPERILADYNIQKESTLHLGTSVPSTVVP